MRGMATAQFEGDDASLLGQQKTRRLIETAHGDFRVQPRVQKVISNKIDRRLAQQIFDPNTPEYVKATDEDEEENLQFRRVLTNSFFKKGVSPEESVAAFAAIFVRVLHHASLAPLVNAPYCVLTDALPAAVRPRILDA